MNNTSNLDGLRQQMTTLGSNPVSQEKATVGRGLLTSEDWKKISVISDLTNKIAGNTQTSVSGPNNHAKVT